MLRLADTSIRIYRKRDGRASFRIRSYLMVNTNTGFRLSAYLKSISCQLTLAEGKVIEFEDVAFSEQLRSEYELNTMIHDFWASAAADMPKIRDGTGKLRLDYHLSFTGHPYEEPSHFECVVPLVSRA